MTNNNDEFDEHAYGVIPVYLGAHNPLFLVIQQHQGHWGFPKGNAESDEEPQEAAVRELAEEVGIEDVDIIDGFAESNEYAYDKEGSMVEKKVVYYLGIIDETDVTIDGEEIIDHEWLPYTAVAKQLTFNEAKETIADARDFLRENDL